MKLPNFEYAAPDKLGDAVALLANCTGEARIIAGGQSLLPIMAFRLASPTLLVDIGGIPGLRDIRVEDDGLHLGPMVRWCDIERSAIVAEHQPLLKEAVAHVAHYQVRNRGTVGGSLALADPAAELPCVAVTCGAVLSLYSDSGTRKVAAVDFILGEMDTDLRSGEIIVDVHFPRWPSGRSWAFKEFAKRRGDFALAGVAAHFDLDGRGAVAECAIGILGAGTHPGRLHDVEQFLIGAQLTTALTEQAGKMARASVDPPHDIHASQAYRKAVVGTLVQRALDAAQTSINKAGAA
ncbi:MAG: aerobic carbon-monoxide dehydrogenase medium subunit [Bradyrhizobium sp.]|jgi:carbon-monoxide dehydrogenase medium subunit|nr:aerobic carbon-monoxide dehydrogenase medium subunit [Bradyrhizobium sp.]